MQLQATRTPRSQVPAPTPGWFRAKPDGLGRWQGPAGSGLGLLFPWPRNSGLNPRGCTWLPKQMLGQRGAGGRASDSEADTRAPAWPPERLRAATGCPGGSAVFTTFPDLLFIFEFVSRGGPGRAGWSGMGWAVPRSPRGERPGPGTGWGRRRVRTVSSPPPHTVFWPLLAHDDGETVTGA